MPEPVSTVPVIDDGVPFVTSFPGISSDVHIEEKYWKTKILYNALESVIFGRDQNQFSPEILYNLRLAFHFDDTTGERQDNTVPPETKIILRNLVAREIQQLSVSVIDTGKKLLIWSIDDSEGKFTDFPDPLEEIVDAVERRKREEDELDEEIRKLQHAQQEDMKSYENILVELMFDLENMTKKASLYEGPQQIHKAKKLDDLKLRCDILKTKSEIVQKQQLLAENPPELTAQLSATRMLLSAANKELRQEISTKAAFLKQYDSLTPDVLKLISELKSTEEAIQRQEWIIKKLIGFSVNSSDPETSINESLTDF